MAGQDRLASDPYRDRLSPAETCDLTKLIEVVAKRIGPLEDPVTSLELVDPNREQRKCSLCGRIPRTMLRVSVDDGSYFICANFKECDALTAKTRAKRARAVLKYAKENNLIDG